MLCFSKKQPYLGRERGGKEANCGNGSHIEAVVKEVEVEITNSARPCSVKHLSSLTGLPNKQSQSCCHPSAPCGNKCFGIFVLPANEHAGQDQAAEVVKHPAFF